MTPFSVSSTPVPLKATASKAGRLRGLSRSFSTESGSAVAVSRLLYWITCGISGSISFTSRFWRRLRWLSALASSIAAWLSATNTTASQPFSTMRRVAS